MLYKTTRIQTEFRREIDRRLAIILTDLDHWLCDMHDYYNLTITCLMRTEEENKKVGGRPFSSHLTGRAADIRTWNMKPELKDAIQRYLWKTWGKEFLHVVVSEHGTAPHIHVNINYPFAIENLTTE